MFFFSPLRIISYAWSCISFESMEDSWNANAIYHITSLTVDKNLRSSFFLHLISLALYQILQQRYRTLFYWQIPLPNTSKNVGLMTISTISCLTVFLQTLWQSEKIFKLVSPNHPLIWVRAKNEKGRNEAFSHCFTVTFALTQIKSTTNGTFTPALLVNVRKNEHGIQFCANKRLVSLVLKWNLCSTK